MKMEGFDKPADSIFWHILMLDPVGSFEIQIYFYQTTRHHNQEDGNIYCHGCEKLKL
jgi:hypothetical protein